MIRAPVNPELLRWARERAGITQEELMAKFRKLPEWEDGQMKPTLKQTEAFARSVHSRQDTAFLEKANDDLTLVNGSRIR